MKKIYIILGIATLIVILPLFIYSFFYQKLGTPADWISGIGTILAVIVSLYLSNKAEGPDVEFDSKKKPNGDHEIKIKNMDRYFVRLEVVNILPKYIKIAGHEYNRDVGIPLSPCGFMMLGDDYTKHDPKFVTTIVVKGETKEKNIILFDRISKKRFKIELD